MLIVAKRYLTRDVLIDARTQVERHQRRRRQQDRQARPRGAFRAAAWMEASPASTHCFRHYRRPAQQRPCHQVPHRCLLWSTWMSTLI